MVGARYRTEVVKKLGVRREAGWLYFLRGTDVWRARFGASESERVVAGSFTREAGYQYNLDGLGNIARIRKRLADAMLNGWPARGEFHALASTDVELRFGVA